MDLPIGSRYRRHHINDMSPGLCQWFGRAGARDAIAAKSSTSLLSLANEVSDNFQEQFKGLVLHSSDYHNSHQWKGLRGVVIGSANTGRNISSMTVE
jgi:hypothetical protein